jgi:hypothetical protein
LDAQALGCAGEAAHFRDRYENEDGLELLHFRALEVFFGREQYVRFLGVYHAHKAQ